MRVSCRVVVVVAVWAWTMLSASCVTLYQPLGGLQQPSLLNPADENFGGTNILVRCIPGEDLPPGDAQRACRMIANSLRLQGAETETAVPRSLDDGLPRDAFDGRGADLTVELSARTEHTYDYPALGLFAVITLFATPTVEEYTYVQDVRLLSKNGGVLASDSYKARFVTYTSWVYWGANWVLDTLIRDDDDDLTGDVANARFSRDFYRQIGQLTYNAKSRADVLGLTQPVRRKAPPPTAPAVDATTSAPATSTSTTTPAAPSSPAPGPAPTTTAEPPPSSGAAETGPTDPDDPFGY